MKRFRFLAVAEWEACGLAAGSMTQKRVPTSLFQRVPRVGALIWVQEPFIHLLGRGRDFHVDSVQYRADAGPAGGFPPQPDDVRNRHVGVHVREAREMRCGQSRFTLEVTRVWERPWSYFEVGDREREGLGFLKEAVPHLSQARAFMDYWRRQYPDTRPPLEGGSTISRSAKFRGGDTESRTSPIKTPHLSVPSPRAASQHSTLPQGEGGKGPPVLMLQFRVHKLNIGTLLLQRASPSKAVA